ncbi:MAG: hypothetical protein ACOYXA_08445 [Bacteroidota bacterium]
MAVKGDATANYKNQLDKFERTLIATDKVITIYDRVKKKSATDVINFVVHNKSGFGQIPTDHPGNFTAENHGGRLTVKTLTAGGAVVVDGMRLRVDFAQPDLDIHLLHGMEANDRSIAPVEIVTPEGIQSDAGLFAGIQYVGSGRSYVHLVNKTEAPAASVNYVAPFAAGLVKHVVTGMKPGNYGVLKDGVVVAQSSATDSGVIFFQTEGSGAMEVRRN